MREAQSDSRITENDNTNTNKSTEGLLERILARDNLNQAYQKVKRNKGAHGVDGMEVDELLQYLKENRDETLTSIWTENTVQIQLKGRNTKGERKNKKLGIPTVVDRVVQQAIAQVLTPIYEKQFSETSYGFRPKRSAHDALKKCQGTCKRRI